MLTEPGECVEGKRRRKHVFFQISSYWRVAETIAHILFLSFRFSVLLTQNTNDDNSFW